MGRGPEEPLTEQVAREVCQRQNVKAMLAGSIAKLGTQYAITLNALNCTTGDSLATGQVEADRKEDVLAKLGASTSALREQLGESLASIRKFDVPIERATTPSLDALKAFTNGVQLHAASQPAKAIPHLERATTLDPQFALAYAQMSTSFNNVRDLTRARELAARAYALRERVSERERFYIETRYYGSVTGEIDQALRAYELWAQTYPRDYVPWNNMGVSYDELGELERALDASLQSRRLNPGNTLAHSNGAFAYLNLNRLADARATADQALVQFPDNPDLQNARLILACREHDMAKVDELLKAGRSRHVIPVLQGAMVCAIWSGRLADARALQEEIADAMGEAQREPRARILVELTSAEWRLGDRSRARADALEAARLLADSMAPARLAAVLAEVGETALARRLIARVTADQPKSTLQNRVWGPLTSSIFLLAENKADAAVQALPAGRFERRWGDVALQRGLAYLQGGNLAAAATEFRRIVESPPAWPPASSVEPYAALSLARTLAASGDRTGARQAYERLFDLWKHADPDLRLLVEARKELAALQ